MLKFKALVLSLSLGILFLSTVVLAGPSGMKLPLKTPTQQLKALAEELGGKKFASLCAAMVESAAANPWDRSQTDFAYALLKAQYVRAPYLPRITPLQMSVLISLEQAPDKGMSVADVELNLRQKGFHITESSISDCLFRMTARKEFVAVDFEKYDEPHFVLTAPAIVQLDNILVFYEKLRTKATATRRTDRARPLNSYLDEEEGSVLVPQVGHTAAVILAHNSPKQSRYLSDLAADIVGEGMFGTPGDMSDVYKTTEDMKREKILDRTTVRPRGRPSRGSTPEDFLEISTTDKGELELANVFRFYNFARSVRSSR